MKPIFSITMVFGTGDDALLSVLRTRPFSAGSPDKKLVMLERVESSDMEAYVQTPVNGRKGTYAVMYTQSSPDHSIPDAFWNAFWGAISRNLQFQAVCRNATILKDQEQIPSPSLAAGKDAVIAALNAGMDFDRIIINDKLAPSAFLTLANKAKHNSVSSSTYDPFYKDSDIPDDIDRHEKGYN
jgi:hypothetical protein